jgi:hypothetical protein
MTGKVNDYASWYYKPPVTNRVSPVTQRASSDCQEHHDRRDVGWLPEPAKRRVRHHLALKIAPDDTSRMRSFGLDDAGIDRVYPDLPRPEFLGQRAGQAIDGTFRRGINGTLRHPHAAGDGADVDNAAAIGREVPERFPGGEQYAEDVGIEVVVDSCSDTFSIAPNR